MWIVEVVDYGRKAVVLGGLFLEEIVALGLQHVVVVGISEQDTASLMTEIWILVEEVVASDSVVDYRDQVAWEGFLACRWVEETVDHVLSVTVGVLL